MEEHVVLGRSSCATVGAPAARGGPDLGGVKFLCHTRWQLANLHNKLTGVLLFLLLRQTHSKSRRSWGAAISHTYRSTQRKTSWNFSSSSRESDLKSSRRSTFPRMMHSAQKDTTFTKIFVGGLPYHTTDSSLRKYFEVFGDIEEAVVITDRQTGKSRGYGFVSISLQKWIWKVCTCALECHFKPQGTSALL